jgi:hypothetical protein
MLKQLSLVASLSVLTCLSAAQSDRIAEINTSIACINQAITDILAEQKIVEAVAQHTEKSIKAHCIDHIMDDIAYNNMTNKILATLEPITASSDFFTTIHYLTDYQVACIVNKHIYYHDIEYNEESYPAEQKSLMQALNQAFAEGFAATEYSQDTLELIEALSNIYHIKATQHLGYKMLLEKLTKLKGTLQTELKTLETEQH